MTIKKRKLSDYPESKSLVGLWTIGYNLSGGVKQTVRVGLEFIKTVIDNAIDSSITRTNTATTNANTATKKADTATQNAIHAVESLRRGVDGGEAHTIYGGCFVFDGGNANTI